jgi:hypothetical protein
MGSSLFSMVIRVDPSGVEIGPEGLPDISRGRKPPETGATLETPWQGR